MLVLLLLLLLPMHWCCHLLSDPTGLDPWSEGGVLPERERRFLGCVRMSLAALYQAEVVDGTFKVSTGQQEVAKTCSLLREFWRPCWVR